MRSRRATGEVRVGALRPLAFSGPHNPPEYKAPLGIILSKFPCSGYNGEALSRILAPYLEAPVVLKILGSEVPRSTAVLCTDSLVARPRGTEYGERWCSYAFLYV